MIIAGAGGAAHLPGMLAAVTPLPVIGVPVPLKYLDGMDSLLSIVQMPAGRAGRDRRGRQRPQRRAARRTHPRRGRRRPAAADGRLPGRAATRRRPSKGAVGPRCRRRQPEARLLSRPAGRAAASSAIDVARCLALLGMVATHVLDERDPDGDADRRPGAGRRAGLGAVRGARRREHRAGHGSRPAVHRCRPCARVGRARGPGAAGRRARPAARRRSTPGSR